RRAWSWQPPGESAKRLLTRGLDVESGLLIFRPTVGTLYTRVPTIADRASKRPSHGGFDHGYSPASGPRARQAPQGRGEDEGRHHHARYREGEADRGRGHRRRQRQGHREG